ncbi:MAG TPA: flagellar biosynthetic protein FliO [Sporichthya sp.]|jgi:flagellar protein FliO/FliZ|nr:flagellar biosynthetic protein FliO [Sporichthya sp.]
MTGNGALLLRVGFSFSLVLLLMWGAARALRNRTAGRPTDTCEVLARTQLGRGSNVTVLRIGDRALVLGVTERAITQLGEPITDLTALRAEKLIREALTPDDLTTPAQPPARISRARRSAAPSAPEAMAGQSALTGSILSPATWRMGMDALRERTVRRG